MLRVGLGELDDGLHDESLMDSVDAPFYCSRNMQAGVRGALSFHHSRLPRACSAILPPRLRTFEKLHDSPSHHISQKPVIRDTTFTQSPLRAENLSLFTQWSLTNPRILRTALFQSVVAAGPQSDFHVLNIVVTLARGRKTRRVWQAWLIF